MSTAQREAIDRYRRRLQRSGVVRVEVQALVADALVLRKLSSVLRGDPVRAAKVRQRLRKMIDEEGPGLKELLASAPLEGIDLTRPEDLGRDVDL